METIGNLDAGQLVTAGKVEEIKATAKKAAEDQVAAAAQASNEMICGTHQGSGRTAECTFHRKGGGAFSRSKFITDKLAVPADMVQAKFGNRFKVENGKLSASVAAVDRLPLEIRRLIREMSFANSLWGA